MKTKHILSFGGLWIPKLGFVLGFTLILMIGSLAVAAPVPGVNVTYTIDADFDLGTLLNVNHDSPNNDQLQLNTAVTPFPFVNIAASGRGTVIRIDVNTGVILGEYLTAPDGMGRNPSRTTVDLVGNVWVSNRNESSVSGGQPKGSVTRVGLILGGTRADAGGTPDPSGQYLAPPFQYNTCLDRDSDGLLKTSSGLGNILSWTNAGGADTDGGVSTAEDECIINYTRVTGTGTRTVAVDANNDVWVGGLGDLDHEKISGLTGSPVPGTQFNLGCGGYGGLVDGNGVLWSARGGTGLLRFDTSALSGACLGFTRGDYGLGIDPQTGEIWHTFLNGERVARLAPDGTLLAIYSHGSPNAQGVAVDNDSNVWVAHSLLGPSTTVGHIKTDGTLVGNVPLPGGSGPTGVSVDSNGKIWVANFNSNNAMRIDPSAGLPGGGGFPVGAVDLTVDLGAGAAPYNYSDMTGFVAIGSTSPQGTWTVTQDGGSAGLSWGTISWNGEPQGSQPPGTSILVEARAADAEVDLSSQTFIPVSNGVPFALTGRFIQVQVTLRPDAAGTSPVLSDISIRSANHPPVADPDGPYSVPEGSTLILDATGSSDPDGDALTYEWDLDNDGTFETTGATPTFSAAGLDGPSTHPVTLRVCDPGGLCDVAGTVVEVTNVPPTANAGPDQTVFRDQVVSLSGTWTDPAASLDDPYAWSWDLTGDGIPDTSGSASYGSAIPGTTSFAAEGTYTLTFQVTDKDGGSGSDTMVVTVLDQPPDCSEAKPSPAQLWPPNHKFVTINVLGVTDPDGDAVSISIARIWQDEPVDDVGDGRFVPDARGVGTGTAEVRAERSGSKKVPGNGRVYHIGFTAEDGHGGSCSGEVLVGVPHDRSRTPVDDGALFDSTLSQ